MIITASKSGVQGLPMRQLLKILISPSSFVNSCHSTVYLYFLNDLDNILILKLMLLANSLWLMFDAGAPYQSTARFYVI